MNSYFTPTVDEALPPVDLDEEYSPDNLANIPATALEAELLLGDACVLQPAASTSNIRRSIPTETLTHDSEDDVSGSDTDACISDSGRLDMIFDDDFNDSENMLPQQEPNE